MISEQVFSIRISGSSPSENDSMLKKGKHRIGLFPCTRIVNLKELGAAGGVVPGQAPEAVGEGRGDRRVLCCNADEMEASTTLFLRYVVNVLDTASFQPRYFLARSFSSRNGVKR